MSSLLPRQTGRLIWIAERVLSSMKHEAIARAPLETGGVLLGYWALESGEPVVTHCVGPGPEAVHKEVSFEPDYAYQSAEIEQLYEISRRTLHYLGDWHSHPNGSGYLSQKDHATFLRIARHKEARAKRPIMVVLAEIEDWSLHSWQLDWEKGWFRRRAKAVPLATRVFSCPE